MKHTIMRVGISMLLVAALFVLFGSVAEASIDRACLNDCRTEKREADISCREEHISCRLDCRAIQDNCLIDARLKLVFCNEACDGDRLCRRQCSVENSASRRECRDQGCVLGCSDANRECRRMATSYLSFCNDVCRNRGEAKTCLDGKYEPGENFLDGCEVCRCMIDGTLDCRKTRYCNFNDVNVPRENCNQAGGFFHKLCTGPYFGVRCDSPEYCLCAGNGNHACPSDHSCVMDFIRPRNMMHAMPGWMNMHGQEIGEIGICAKMPELPYCGDGICDAACDGNDCRMAETIYNCPEDCIPGEIDNFSW